MPEISVVVPIYNTEAYLPGCLDALLAQTVRDIEILAVNNGCTDGCADILARYAAADDRIRVINKAHGDIYTARNAGLRAAAGDWIAFCDSDDTLPPKAYAHMLRKAKSSNCDVVVGWYVEWDERHGKLPTVPPAKNRDTFQALMFPGCVWNKMIRRAFLEEHGLEFPAVPFEDVAFLAKLVSCSPRVACLDRPIYFYWQHYSGSTASLSHRYSLAVFKGLLQSHRSVYEELRETPYRSEAAEYVSCYSIPYMKEYLPQIWDSGEKQACFELFRQHILSFPWEGQDERFLQIFGAPLSAFRTMTAEDYLRPMTALSPRKAVLVEYQEGRIGFQYIFAYFKAWLTFKIKKFTRGA